MDRRRSFRKLSKPHVFRPPPKPPIDSHFQQFRRSQTLVNIDLSFSIIRHFQRGVFKFYQAPAASIVLACNEISEIDNAFDGILSTGLNLWVETESNISPSEFLTVTIFSKRILDLILSIKSHSTFAEEIVA